MISYGSQQRSAEMPCDNRSHQLGEGQSINTEMSGVVYPSRPVYGSQQDCTPMSPCDRSHQLGKGQPRNTGMSVVVHPSRQLGEGHDTFAEMPYNKRPSQPVLESQGSNAEMPMRDRSQGKGQGVYAERSILIHPSPPVYGSRTHNAAMPMEKRSHLFTRGHQKNGAMPKVASQGKGQ